MSDPATALDPLIADLVAWIDGAPRAYDEVMTAWRTSCPRLTVWEDALDRGFVRRVPAHGTGGATVVVTDAGRAFLRAQGRAAAVAPVKA